MQSRNAKGVAEDFEQSCLWYFDQTSNSAWKIRGNILSELRGILSKKCLNLFDNLDNIIQSNEMLHAMKLKFKKDDEGEWDCAQTFDFCHYGR